MEKESQCLHVVFWHPERWDNKKKKKKASKGLDSTVGTTLFCVAGTETGRNLLAPHWKQAWHQHGQSLDFMFAKQPERKIKFDFYKIISTSELLIILIFWYQKEI